MSRENNEMAYIAEVTHIFPIKDADRIVKAVINAGWPCVVKKDEFQVGDLVVYFEVDGFIPNSLAPFLTKPDHYPKEYNGVQGERLKTIKLKGQKSQGLVLPLSILPTHDNGTHTPELATVVYSVGELVGDMLGVQKWEAPETFASGNAKGNFPSFVPKTDAERIQNLRKELKEWVDQDLTFEITEKLHGTSFTAIWCDNELTVCSRNLALKEESEGTYWNVAKRNMLEEKFIALGASGNFAIQGEILGPGICGNQYKLDIPTLYVFNVFNIETKTYLEPKERIEFVEQLGLNHVPVIGTFHSIEGTPTIESILALADGKSVINGSPREGFVFKCIEDPSIQFKAVSDEWLLKEK